MNLTEQKLKNSRITSKYRKVTRVLYETIGYLRKQARQLSDEELTRLKEELRDWLK
tara:strand:- start:13004 stop:13171 length:168 start_codon:yes stop_codon:yes gene_type:complete